MGKIQKKLNELRKQKDVLESLILNADRSEKSKYKTKYYDICCEIEELEITRTPLTGCCSPMYDAAINDIYAKRVKHCNSSEDCFNF